MNKNKIIKHLLTATSVLLLVVAIAYDIILIITNIKTDNPKLVLVYSVVGVILLLIVKAIFYMKEYDDLD